MNNEPVAWMVEDDEDRYFLVNGKGLANPDDSWKSVTPLYTHPAKTLTDEEIEIAKNESTVYKGIYDGYGNGVGQKREIDYKQFARAILRKAQEK